GEVGVMPGVCSCGRTPAQLPVSVPRFHRLSDCGSAAAPSDACLSTGKAGVPYNPAASTSMARARAKRAGTHHPACPLAVPVGQAGWCVLIRTPCAIARCEAGGVSARWLSDSSREILEVKSHEEA